MSSSNRSRRNFVSTTVSGQNFYVEASSSAPTATSSKRGRRKSRSPRGQRVPVTEVLNVGKKKRSTPSFSAPTDDLAIDRGRKSKPKPTGLLTQSWFAVENTNTNAPSQRVAKKERDRSKSRDLHHHRKHANAQSESGFESQNDHDTQSDVAGTLAGLEMTRLKKEIEVLRKQLHDNKKTIKKQTKTILGLQQEAIGQIEALKDKDSQVSKLKLKHKKAEEVVSTVETNMTCQICMELLFKPFALSPCGHIFCLTCLQEWFRKAPPGDDDMYDEADPLYMTYRRKLCPCCRAVVRHRPIPVFLLKSIATTLSKANKGTIRRVSPPPSEDVWEGLFFPADHDNYDDDGDGDDDDDDDDEDVDSDYDSDLQIFSYDSDSDDEPYTGGYVPARWEPPNTNVDPEHYTFDDLSPSQLSLLRRGCTLPMIHAYHMDYDHSHGITAYIDGENSVNLGWNVVLSADDEDGERFMNWIYNDVLEKRERWDVRPPGQVRNMFGGWEARRLVRPDLVEEYSDTDSDNWLNDEDDASID